MNSVLNQEFIKCFRKLPERIKKQAKKNYRLWVSNTLHPSLDFKQVHTNLPIYSIRVVIGWRALGLKENDTIIWYWIGSHSDYEKLIS